MRRSSPRPESVLQLFEPARVAEARAVMVDPYRSCESGCNHDCGRGVLLEELLSGDGPYTPEIIQKGDLRWAEALRNALDRAGVV